MQPRDDGPGAPGQDPRWPGRRNDRLQDRGCGAGQEREPEHRVVNAAGVIGDGVRDVPPAEVPHQLCALVVKLLPVSGASVSLCGSGMPVQVSASDDAAARMADVQATLGDGPCLYAAEIGAPVLASDLTTGRDVRRWPVFAQQAAEAGVQAVYSLPLGNDAVCVGTLDLYGGIPHELSGRELHTAQLVAGAMTLALMSLSHEVDIEERADHSWLSGLTTDHDEVYQAIGMIMAQLGVGSDEALARLRARAFAQGRTALDVAHEVISCRERFDGD
ncbi:GAF and ANTAR domain-containing protein [Streptomyces sp. NPDC046197]|uniref:GAF and ANTAR domain-containing protein n=1 Tax=Streptomyces sp. NPDC046197 TaxID=3154337 RepID=UPI0033E1EE23